MLALFIIGGIFAYATMAGLLGGLDHKRRSRDCYASHCFGGSWCDHCFMSVWISGLLWLPALPVLMGIFASGAARPKTGTRTERRREREIEEAKHKAELAEIKAREHAALDRELSLINQNTAGAVRGGI